MLNRESVPDPDARRLLPDHRDYLRAHAISDEVIDAAGVFSVSRDALASYDEMPEDLRWIPPSELPAIVFPCRTPDGRVEYVIRPDFPSDDPETGRPVKYRTRHRKQGYQPFLWVVRHVEHPDAVLLCEGMKQAAAAASYAPEGTAVYGFGGKDQWMTDGIPTADLHVVDGLDVVMSFDADAAGNVEVFDSATMFGKALLPEGALSVGYIQLPARGSAGLDDVLASKSEDRRAGYLAKLIDSAAAKPADRRPPAKSKKADEPPAAGDDRVTVVVNDDRRKVIDALTAALIKRFDGTELFNFGGVISRLRDHKLEPIDAGTFNDTIQDAAITVERTQNGYEYDWPDSPTMKAVLSRAREFTGLDAVRRTPFVRSDGTVCSKPGYDADSRTMLILDEDLGEIDVPDEPTDDEVDAAVTLILCDWLGDMPFADQASEANALALVLTFFIRSLVPLVPLAAVDGLQMSVGKGLFGDCLSILVLGEITDVKPYNTDDTEHRKVILSAFRAGDELFIFDEAHSLQGASFARAITAMSYSDRILGVSKLAQFPNKVTWVSLGNQVRVHGDMVRRVYRIQLKTDTPNPENRPLSGFKHSDLRGWTRENRADLVRACLVLVRRWFAAGSPAPSGDIWFGSFEAWQRTVGGILEQAGVGGFLGNVREWRSEADFDSRYWAAHLEWLWQCQSKPADDKFAVVLGDEFTAAEVKNAALADPSGYQAPPGLDDPATKGYAKELGQSYHRVKDRRYDEYSITRVGTAHTKIAKWKVVRDSPDSPEGPEGPEEPLPPTRVRGTRPVDDREAETRVHREKGLDGSSGSSGPSAGEIPENARDVCPDCHSAHGVKGCYA